MNTPDDVFPPRGGIIRISDPPRDPDRHTPTVAVCICLVLLGFSGCTAYCAHEYAPVALENVRPHK